MENDRQQLLAGRHRAIIVLLLAHVPLLWMVGVWAGWSFGHIAAEVILPLVGFAAVGWYARRSRVAAAAGGLGLMYVSAVLVHITGGVTEAHFYFFVAFGLVALYRDWVVFFVAAGFAVGHHVVFALSGAQLFGQPYQLERPVFWAAVHITFVTIVTAVQAIGMDDVARSVSARTAAETAADEAVQRAEERRRTALELHDNVVQALATANYARALGEDHTADSAVADALDASRSLVSELLAGSPVDETMLRRRTPVPSQA